MRRRVGMRPARPGTAAGTGSRLYRRPPRAGAGSGPWPRCGCRIGEGVKLEQQILITETGNELLTTYPLARTERPRSYASTPRGEACCFPLLFGPLGPRPRSTLCEDMNCRLSARPLTRVRVAMGVKLRVPPTPSLERGPAQIRVVEYRPSRASPKRGAAT